MFRHCLITAIALSLAGCAASSTATHIDSPEKKVANEATIDKPFDEVWDHLIANLAKSFFVINNVDKTSRIINVSFSADQPGDLVDCGKSMRTFKLGTNNQSYNYDTAGPAHYFTASPNGQQTAEVNRTTSLEGRANIYVAPKEQKTEISVNARYVLSVNVVAQVYDAYGQPFGYPMAPGPRPFTFETSAPGKFTDDQGTSFSCQSRGVLEKRIMEAAGAKN